LRALRVFDKVVASGSFAAAARSLDMTPPVVTRLLAELEAHLGVRLLNRTTRVVRVTEPEHVMPMTAGVAWQNLQSPMTLSRACTALRPAN